MTFANRDSVAASRLAAAGSSIRTKVSCSTRSALRRLFRTRL